MCSTDDLGLRQRGGDGWNSTPIHRGGGWGGRRKKRGDHDDDLPSSPRLSPHLGHPTISAVLPSLVKLSIRVFLGTTVVLYILNQKHMLPKPLGSFVSRALFWPTLPITIANRIGKWSTVIDDTVIMGGAPFGFANIPEHLLGDYNVRGVVNMCDEYRGPVGKYDELGMQELWLRTVDHFEPSVEDLQKAVSFIRYHKNAGNRVYVHCRAGHGRSAAVTFAWLMYNHPNADLMELNMHLCRLRNVRKTLWKQPNINRYRNWLKGRKPTKFEDSWLPSRKIREKGPERRGEVRPAGDESESDIEKRGDDYWQQIWEEDSKSSSIRTKLDKIWRKVFGSDDMHVIDSDSDFSSAELSESEVNMEYFN